MTEDMILTILSAVELGYRHCEAGMNLEQTLEIAKKLFYPILPPAGRSPGTPTAGGTLSEGVPQ
jgi:hypothetical protein